jgi:hypothetical protein
MKRPFASRPLPYARRRKTKEEKERSAYYGRIHAESLERYRREAEARDRKESEPRKD